MNSQHNYLCSLFTSQFLSFVRPNSGGGVLAHTILGVDYDKENDVAKFLVLDPHYPGEENISVIQSKGWCGWKTANFWKKGTFYNMCLPMKKSCV